MYSHLRVQEVPLRFPYVLSNSLLCHLLGHCCCPWLELICATSGPLGGKQGKECTPTILKTWADNGNHHFLLTFDRQGVRHRAPFNRKKSRTCSPHTQLSGLWKMENKFRSKIAVSTTPS